MNIKFSRIEKKEQKALDILILGVILKVEVVRINYQMILDWRQHGFRIFIENGAEV